MISFATLQQVWTVTGTIAAIVFGFLYAKKKNVKETEKKTDDAEDRLVVILQGTVTALEKKVGDLEKAQTESSNRIKDLETENEIVNRVLQGRDGKSEELYAMSKENSMNIKNLYTLMERHISIVEKALNITATAQHQPGI